MAWSSATIPNANAEDAARCLEAQLKELGHSVLAVRANVCAPEDMQGVIDMIEAEFGRLDCLVNNAGVIQDNLVLSMSRNEWDSVIDTNLTGAFNCIKPAATLMMKARSGTIINISSIAATRPGRGHSNYAASKGGLEAMTKALAVELAPKGIRVNCIAPGMIETDMSKDVRELAGERILEKILLGRFGRPEEVADAVSFLSGSMATYVTGTVLHVDGGAGA